MKAILEFNMPDDEAAFDMARQGSELHCVVFGYLEHDLRNWIKHGIPDRAELRDGVIDVNTPEAALEMARDALLRRLEDAGIRLD